MALIDFTLSNARRFYSSMGNPLGWKGNSKAYFCHTVELNLVISPPYTKFHFLCTYLKRAKVYSAKRTFNNVLSGRALMLCPNLHALHMDTVTTAIPEESKLFIKTTTFTKFIGKLNLISLHSLKLLKWSSQE